MPPRSPPTRARELEPDVKFIVLCTLLAVLCTVVSVPCMVVALVCSASISVLAAAKLSRMLCVVGLPVTGLVASMFDGIEHYPLIPDGCAAVPHGKASIPRGARSRWIRQIDPLIL